jgi:hypothetical protein
MKIILLTLSFLMTVPVQAWEFEKLGTIITFAESNKGWSYYLTGSVKPKQGVFCFIGPFAVKKGNTYDLHVKYNKKPYQKIRAIAHDNEALCINNTDTAFGLLGVLYKYGSFTVGLYVGDEFRGIKILAGNIGKYAY